MKNIFASIITIGDELLIGQVIDTNSAWLAQELNKMGIKIKHRIAVGDIWEDIWNALDEESKNADIILITGGLGPTSDDITKPLLCQYFNGKMIVHQPTLAFITDLFEKVLNRPMIERNKKQAEVPDTCTVLPNEKGTAPGMLFEKNGKLFISMPGVPHEMKWIFSHQASAFITQKYNSGYIEHRTLLIGGIGESFLAEKLIPFEQQLPSHIKLAYLPNFGMIRLRLSAFSIYKEKITEEINYQFNLLKQYVSDFLILDDDLPLEAVVGKLLHKQQKTIATAESCTGGYIAHLITSIPGSSNYFKGSIVGYNNTIKHNLLHVSNETLNNAGAVSKETVTQMANHIANMMQTDYAIAVSGIMGPDGGTEEKPVGTVWIAVTNNVTTITKQFHFRFDRIRNIQLTATNALNLVRQLIVDNR